jgi:hypothetical protein
MQNGIGSGAATACPKESGNATARLTRRSANLFFKVQLTQKMYVSTVSPPIR